MDLKRVKKGVTKELKGGGEENFKQVIEQSHEHAFQKVIYRE